MAVVSAVDIRPMREEDIPSVLEVFDSLADFFYPRDIRRCERDYQAALADGEALPRRYYVAYAPEDPKKIIGTLGYRREVGADRVYYLEHFGVHADERGSGIGKALLGKVESELVSRECRIVYAWTSTKEYAEGARAFYESAGYALEAVVPDYWQDGDPLAIYAKRLG